MDIRTSRWGDIPRWWVRSRWVGGPEVLGSEGVRRPPGSGGVGFPGFQGFRDPLETTCFQPVTRIPLCCTSDRITGRQQVTFRGPIWGHQGKGTPLPRPLWAPFRTPFGPLLGRWCAVVMQRDVL